MVVSPDDREKVVNVKKYETGTNFNNNIYNNFTPDHVIDGPSNKVPSRDLQAEIQKSIEGV